jgi:1-pyrroline-5-carboxylate dehydrogenase
MVTGSRARESPTVALGRPGPGRHPLHRLDAGLPALWRTVGENIDKYRTYPRLVGETGGKDFILAHPSADPTW